MITPAAGSILFDGQTISGLSPDEIVARGLVMAPEARQLFPVMSARDNVLMGAYHPAAREGMRRRFDEVLDLFPRVRERLDQFAISLTGGEQQMVALARGLMAKPRLLMLDEPSLGLAPLIVAQMFELVERICAMGTTVLLIEQKAFHALRIARRAYAMENGRIVKANAGAGRLADPDIKSTCLGL